MREATGRANGEAQNGGSSSFLVRMWREPQAEGSGPVRVYLRNLQTGEELYLGDPKRVGEILATEIETDSATGNREDRTTEAQAI